ncbi:hypothetical protein A2957_00445 [Candidatus Roizmanbacteria bacterium RIFCSPLOWO2_01_FULL_38_11]|uniref:histidine kinase n=1 Tax=Candidatus Roizmanbacteria bacterium RIFCSPLOWO2_01_FULL_38_11 TaxID=1802060 RepID=A0A1F7IKI1_9BACT|nr:MAG: hypothetical protein A2957_00445 [Candidatus Roizmanbacteria bacterium RIFCSPLOWO2_01_FULL_38_11]
MLYKKKILKVLLISSTLLGFSAIINNLIGIIEAMMNNHVPNNGVGVLVLVILTLIFLTLYLMTNKGYIRFASYVLIYILILSSLYSSIFWGADIPQSLLIFALAIVMSGILINTRFAVINTILISFFLLLISYLQINNIVHLNLYWKKHLFGYSDTFIHISTLAIIMVVSWLYNREIEASLQRAETSEEELRKERDLLEIKVEQRTEELKKEQLEKMLNLYRFADFGKLASGLLHDLVSPLTTVSINLEQLSKKKGAVKVQEIDEIINRTVEGTKRMESYVKAARAHIQKQSIEKHFYICDEIENVLHIFAYRIKKENIPIDVNCHKKTSMIGNPIKFNQLMSNLVANALDSYEDLPRTKRGPIFINATKEKNEIVITIEDHGKGIKKNHLKNIFDPFFTTKKAEKGTGIGLAISKDIVEKIFHGEIKVRSIIKKGTTFTVTIPIKP